MDSCMRGIQAHMWMYNVYMGAYVDVPYVHGVSVVV